LKKGLGKILWPVEIPLSPFYEMRIKKKTITFCSDMAITLYPDMDRKTVARGKYINAYSN